MNKPMKKVIAIAFCLLAFVLLNELFRRSQELSWGVFLVLPLLLFPWWRKSGKHSLFGWVKTYSTVFGVAWLIALRFTDMQNFEWAFVIGYLILVTNILEAMILDISQKNTKHSINALAGLILLFTLPGYTAISVDESSQYRDLIWDIPLYWIIGYTLWNILFVYMQTPKHLGMHIAVLGSAFVVGLIDNKLWLQTRGYTLGIFLIIFFTYKPTFDSLRTPNVTHEKIALGVALFNLLWAILIALVLM